MGAVELGVDSPLVSADRGRFPLTVIGPETRDMASEIQTSHVSGGLGQYVIFIFMLKKY